MLNPNTEVLIWSYIQGLMTETLLKWKLSFNQSLEQSLKKTVIIAQTLLNLS